MGGIWLQRIELLSTLSEHAGSKAGLALEGRQLRRNLPDHTDVLTGRGDQLLRIRAEELAMMGAELGDSRADGTANSAVPLTAQALDGAQSIVSFATL